MKNVLVIDNYDSFTYNLVHYLEDLDCKVTVVRNDKLELDDVEAFDKIVLSPGPGIPDEAGLLKSIIETYASTKSILGVCLGHQAIAESFTGELENMSEVLHGVGSTINIIADDVIYTDLPKSFEVGRYHSWQVKKDSVANSFEVTAVDGNNNVMSIRHKEYDVVGVQYHPESILTENGLEIMKNWLSN